MPTTCRPRVDRCSSPRYQLNRNTSRIRGSELAISNMWETSALVELLERKGILTKQEVLAMIHELCQHESTAIPPHQLDT